MALSRTQLFRQVWYEVKGLSPGAPSPNNPMSDMRLLGATIGSILSAQNDPTHNDDGAPQDPCPQRDRADEVRQGLDAITSGSLDGKLLARQAALLQLGPDGKPIPPHPALPDALSGVLDPTAMVLGTYVRSDPPAGEPATYGLMCPADKGYAGPPAFASVVTETGLQVDTQTVSAKRLRLGKILIGVSVVGFCATACNIYTTGQQLAQSYRLIMGDRFGYDQALLDEYAILVPIEAMRARLPVTGDHCKSALTDPASGTRANPVDDRTSGCLYEWQAAMVIAWSGYVPNRDAELQDAQDRIVSQAAAAKAAAEKAAAEKVAAQSGASAANAPPANAGKTDDKAQPAQQETSRRTTQISPVWWKGIPFALDAWRNIGTPMASAQVSIVLPTAVLILFTVLLAVACGLLVKGVPAGILISDRNRLTLARTQVIAWSMLVLPVITAYACFNAGFGARAMLLNPPGGAGINGGGFVIFPSMPGEILAALGISVGSALLSPLILQGKPSTLDLSADASNKVNDDVTMFKDPTSVLHARSSPADASISDLFLGELQDNHDEMDISRLQMVVITIGLLLTYGSLLFAQAAAIDLQAVFAAVKQPRSIFDSLPQAGATFFTLMAVSHGTYLVTKTSLIQQGSSDSSTGSASS